MSEPMNRNAMTEYIKVNLPLTERDYAAGNGEGVWVLVDPETKKAHDEEATGGLYVGILDNDSCYYPCLNHGELIPSRAFAEGGIHEAIMAYEDVTFFEILAEELALRDLGEPTRENYEAILDRMERYMGEFEENGTDHITVELE